MPRPNMQALRKPLETDVEIIAPRYTRGDNYIVSCFHCRSFSGFAYTRRGHNALITNMFVNFND